MNLALRSTDISTLLAYLSVENGKLIGIQKQGADVREVINDGQEVTAKSGSLESRCHTPNGLLG
jgi:hypothetical protein